VRRRRRRRTPFFDEVHAGGTMNWERDESFGNSESAVAQGMRETADDAQAAVMMVADEVACDLKHSGAKGACMLSTISALADGAARGAVVGVVAEGFMIGAICGADETPERTLIVIGHAADSFLKHAYQSGFSASAAARGLVTGAAEWAEKCFLGQDEAAYAAAQGAATAADDIGPGVGRKVRTELAVGEFAPRLRKPAAPAASF
jgi:hypothetical protein